MTFDEREVRRVAELAALTLTEEEVTLFAEQIGRILTYVQKLQEVDTTGVEPTLEGGVPIESLRPDEVRPSLPHEQALCNAPDAQDGMFRVPKVLDQ
ncbi:MAG: Asp-tRNA(Asn)/Glu-tRNA(Gln) amidotransferase subunit GatC [Phycisphaerales bacterium]|nr:MAG: Asp-tRNA(Asn)/Glu-tRNA(Gln) amidotransferase subunit GatC [Phycisphaerales bacterium]